jgi:hypothetical protein
MKTALPSLVLVIGTMLCPLLSAAQRHLSQYHLQSIPQSYHLQPGSMPQTDFYITALPTGYTSLNLSKRGFAFSALEALMEEPSGMDGEEGGFFDLDFNKVIDGLNLQNALQMDFQTNWLSFGFRASRNFFHFDANEHVNASLRLPRALFELVNDLDFENPLLTNGTYALGNLGADVNHYRSFGLGYTRQILPSLSAGFKARLLQGIGSIYTQNNQFTIDNNPDELRLRISGDVGVFTSGLLDQDNYLRSKGNNGLALDFGLNYLFADKLALSASLLNIGNIQWRNNLSFEGIYAADYQFPTDDIDAFENEFGRFLDSLSSDAGAVPEPYKTRLPAMAYLGANYYFGKQTALSLTINPRFHQQKTEMAYALGIHTRIKKMLQLGLNYAYFNSKSRLGAGLGLNLGPIQIFAATDDILSALRVPDVDYVHANAGISLSFGRRTRTAQLALFNPAFAEQAPRTPKPKPEKAAALPPPQAKSEKNIAPPKPVKEKPVEAKPVEETPTVSIPAATLNQYCTFRASAKDQQTKAPVNSVQVNIYALDGTQEELVFTRYFFSGNIEVPLERQRDYRIVIRHNAYQEATIRIDKADLARSNDIIRDIQLNLKTL